MKNILAATTRGRGMKIGEVYFYTAAINSWKSLLANDNYKEIIVNSWDYLSQQRKIDVFGFVIMPTHLNAIWRMNDYNGKESSQDSFLKYTAHEFKKLISNDPEFKLVDFAVDAYNKRCEFWQTSQLAIPLYSRKVAIQKLNYMHNNPLSKHWSLATSLTGYKYSSAKYYDSQESEFHFLKNIWNVF